MLRQHIKNVNAKEEADKKNKITNCTKEIITWLDSLEENKVLNELRPGSSKLTILIPETITCLHDQLIVPIYSKKYGYPAIASRKYEYFMQPNMKHYEKKYYSTLVFDLTETRYDRYMAEFSKFKNDLLVLKEAMRP